MSNAVFLCGECGKYFSTINDIRAHSCWVNLKTSVPGTVPSETVVEESTELTTTILEEPAGCSRIEDEEEEEASAIQLSLDDSYVKSTCYAYVDEGKWTEDSVKLLIQFYKEREADFRNPEKRKREVWESIAAELNREGYLFTTDQVDTKWRNLKKAYWRSKEAQCEIGAPSRFCYEDLLDEIYGHILPKRLQVSRVIPRVIRRALITGAAGGSQETSSEDINTFFGIKRGASTERNKPGPKKQCVREFQDLVAIMEKIREDQAEMEDERRRFKEEKLKLLIQMHDEKLSMLKELCDSVKIAINKK